MSANEQRCKEASLWLQPRTSPSIVLGGIPWHRNARTPQFRARLPGSISPCTMCISQTVISHATLSLPTMSTIRQTNTGGRTRLAHQASSNDRLVRSLQRRNKDPNTRFRRRHEYPNRLEAARYRHCRRRYWWPGGCYISSEARTQSHHLREG